jgi:hypothetical protein
VDSIGTRLLVTDWFGHDLNDRSRFWDKYIM